MPTGRILSVSGSISYPDSGLDLSASAPLLPGCACDVADGRDFELAVVTADTLGDSTSPVPALLDSGLDWSLPSSFSSFFDCSCLLFLLSLSFVSCSSVTAASEFVLVSVTVTLVTSTGAVVMVILSANGLV